MFSAGFFGGIKNAAAFKAQLRLVLLIPRARLMAGRFLQRMERFIFFYCLWKWKSDRGSMFATVSQLTRHKYVQSRLRQK
jgi:hypothetical protein